MDSEKDRKRNKDKHRHDDEIRNEKKSKRGRSRSRSPGERRERDPRRKRRHSRSRSPDVPFKQEKQNESQSKNAEVKKEASERKNKENDMLNTRTGGAYIPPARLRMMQAQITDKSSAAYQRLAWEALKKSIHGHINKINVGNIGIIIKELLRENIVRGRGLLCRSVIQAQAASPTFTNVYAALVAAVNSRFPNIGELLLKRLVIQFKRGFKRNDKPICISSASFIAHLVNQRVAHEILALELLTLLVETPTDDSVEVAIAFLKECGQKLTEVSSKGVNAIFEMLRNILHEGQLDKRVQYMIEVMFQVWKDGFKDHPALIEELELVPEEEQFTHLLMLDDATDAQDILNVFKLDDKYEENEQKYKNLCKEILGSDAESGEEGSGSEEGSDDSDEEGGNEDEEKKGEVTIIDNTETNLIALRRTIYLTINSSLDFEECAHKLMKMQLKPGQEVELCHMFLDCCAEQRTYEKFYGLLAQRFCNINRIYIGPFEDIFKDSYATAHRLDTNRLRNVSKFFAHLLFTDSISWEVMECVRLNEEDTTSSSRIYIKILFQELAEYMGLKKLNDRLKDQTLQGAFSGIFPRDNPKNTRFSINFFTSIGLGGLTDELREHLKQMPKNMPPTDIKVADTSSDSSSSSSDSSSSSSDSEEEGEKSKKKKKDKSKKKKDKNGPKTPEAEESEKPVERWGHDGFYDTYGKDARRAEPRRDKDNFVMPNAPRPRPPRRDDDRRRNGDDGRTRDEDRDDRRRRERDDENRPEIRELEQEGREAHRLRNKIIDDESGYESKSKSDRERDDVRDRRRDDTRSGRKEIEEEGSSKSIRERDDVRHRRRDDTRSSRKEIEEKSSKSGRERDDVRDRRRDDTRSGRKEIEEERSTKSDRERNDVRDRRRDDTISVRTEIEEDRSTKSDRERDDVRDRRRDDTRSGRKEIVERSSKSNRERDAVRDRKRDDTRSGRKEIEEERSSKSDRERDDVRDRKRDDTRSGRKEIEEEMSSKSDRERVDVRDRKRDDTKSGRKEIEEERSSKRDKENKKGRNKEYDSSKDSLEKTKKREKKTNSKAENESSSDSGDSSSGSSDSEDDKKSRTCAPTSRRDRGTEDGDIRRGSSLPREENENENIEKQTKKRNSSSKYKVRSDNWDIRRESSLQRETDEREKDRVAEEDWDISRESSLRREIPTSRYWDNYNTQKSKRQAYSEAKKRSPERSSDRRRM